MRVALGFLCLLWVTLAGRAAPESSPPHPPVWAFYYAWYDTPAGPKASWSFWADKQVAGQPTRWRIPAQPLAGAYDSTDVATTAWHLQLADAAGIDALLVSWWGGANVSGQAFESVILPAAAKTKVQVALNCELAQFHADVLKLAEQLSGVLLRTKDHPGYLHVDGRPVVYLYQVPFAPKLTPATFTQLRTEVEKRVGPVWWAMDKIAYRQGAYGVPEAWRQTPGIDGFGFYGTFSVKRISTEAELTPFFRTYAGEVRQTSSKLLLPMHPALDNSRIQPESAYVIKGLEGATLQAYHRAALTAGADILLLTSFNEWPEGTMVEPSADWADPYQYLRMVSAWKGKAFVPPPLPVKK
jgi:hypothetical protein